MDTQCNPTQLEFHALGKREVVGKFDGGCITSDAGGLLLRETEERVGIISEILDCAVAAKASNSPVQRLD